MLPYALLLAFPFAPALQEPELPGLAEVPAGRVWLGTDLDQVKEWIAASPADADILGAEIPEVREETDRFFIGLTEVTNEQYLEFVKASGYMPPASWMKLTREQLTDILAWGKEKYGQESSNPVSVRSDQDCDPARDAGHDERVDAQVHEIEAESRQ